MRFIGGRPSSAHALLPDVLAPTYNGETSIVNGAQIEGFNRPIPGTEVLLGDSKYLTI